MGGLGAFNEILTRGLYVSAIVLYQLSYEEQHTGGRPIYWVYQPHGRNETQNEIMWTAGMQMKLICPSQLIRNLRNCVVAHKNIFPALMGFEPVASALALQCSISWAVKTHTQFSSDVHIHFICIPAVHTISNMYLHMERGEPLFNLPPRKCRKQTVLRSVKQKKCKRYMVRALRNRLFPRALILSTH